MATSQPPAEKKQEMRNWVVFSPIFMVQVGSALALTISVLYGGYHYMYDYIPMPASNDLEDKLTFFIRYCVFPCAVLLFLSIMDVVFKRGMSAAVNPFAGKEHLVAFKQNCLTNTVENTLVFLMLALTLTSYLDADEMKIIPVYTTLWLAGRVFFRIGYSIHFILRAFGFAITVFSTVLNTGYVFYLMYHRGFLCGIRSSQGGYGVGTGKPEL